MEIRTATMNDLDAVAAVEAECFPVAEAATKEEFAERIKYYGDHFWLMFEGDKLIAFLDGFVTDVPDLTDEMYAKASMHDENGAWQMLFGLNTLPEYRKNGYAGELLHRAVEDARKQGRKGAVLTCKQRIRLLEAQRHDARRDAHEHEAVVNETVAVVLVRDLDDLVDFSSQTHAVTPLRRAESAARPLPRSSARRRAP